MRKMLCAVLAVVLMLGMVPFVFAEDSGAHVIVNQVYGASDDGYASHSFIELYNPTNTAVDLTGWSVQYRSSADGDQNDRWYVHPLSGVIGAGSYYLIRCGAVKKPAGSVQVPEGNEEWDIVLHNKGLSVVLMQNDAQLTDSFSGNITAEGFSLPDGFVDLAAAQGNDGKAKQAPPAYEGEYAAIQSKKKAIRRKDFSDTDNNKTDFEGVDYSKVVSSDKGPHTGDTQSAPVYTPVETTDEKYYGF